MSALKIARSLRPVSAAGATHPEPASGPNKNDKNRLILDASNPKIAPRGKSGSRRRTSLDYGDMRELSQTVSVVRERRGSVPAAEQSPPVNHDRPPIPRLKRRGSMESITQLQPQQRPGTACAALGQPQTSFLDSNLNIQRPKSRLERRRGSVDSCMPTLTMQSVSMDELLATKNKGQDTTRSTISRHGKRRASLPELYKGNEKLVAEGAVPELTKRSQMRAQGAKWGTLESREKSLVQANKRPGKKNQKLTKKKFVEVQLLWDKYDRDQNGKIDRSEFEAAIAHLNPSLSEHAASMFDSFDHDNDGELSFAEFVRMQCPWVSRKEVQQCLDKWLETEPEPEDPNRLSNEEIRAMFDQLASRASTFSAEKVVTFEQLVTLCPEFDMTEVIAGDKDGNGELDWDEFFALLRGKDNLNRC